jgi:hypothetical protein
MRLNKNIKIFVNYFFGPLLFLWLCTSIYTQVRQQPHLEQSWQQLKTTASPYKIILLMAVLLLMVANWSVEAVKWKISVTTLRPMSFLKAFYAVLSGVSFSVSMPNRIGEYAGRVLYLPEGSRLKAVPISLVGSISQLLVTLLAGTIGLAILQNDFIQQAGISTVWFRFIFSGTLLATLLLTVFYFATHVWQRLLQRWLPQQYVYIFEVLRSFDASLLLRLLSLSGIRYIIFTLQYVLLFSFFEVHVPPHVAWSVTAVLFLTMAVIPTIALAELGLRGHVSLQLLGLFTANSLGVVLTSVTVWIINLMLPALAGSVLILTLNVFKRTNERI